MFGRRQFSTHKGFRLTSHQGLSAGSQRSSWVVSDPWQSGQPLTNMCATSVSLRWDAEKPMVLPGNWQKFSIAPTLGINLQSSAIHSAFVSSNSASVQVKLVKDSLFLYPPTPCLFLCPSLSPSLSILDDKIPRCWLNPEYDNLPVSKVRLSLEISVCVLVCCWRQAKSCNKNNYVLISAVHSANMPIIHPKEDYVIQWTIRQSTMSLCVSAFTSTFYTHSLI